MFREEGKEALNTQNHFERVSLKERFVSNITIYNSTDGTTFLFINWVIDQKLFMSFSQRDRFFV